jgi:crotonobetainyl-CoA:carnitine CoA-transferase CaiB-like acyl-CoA transferase
LAQSSNPDSTTSIVGHLPLAGVSVVECGQGVAAAFAARMLALLGARVIKVEPPAGDLARRRGPFPNDVADPDKSGLFAYLNADKYGVTLDLTKAHDRLTLDALLDDADMLVHNVPPPERAACGMDNRQLSQRFPRLIAAGISAYGDFGPRANYKAYEINAMHAGGMAALGPLCSPFPELAPLKIFGHHAEFMGGIHAAAVMLAAYLSRMKSGHGQAIEVSEQECIAAMLELSFVYYPYQGEQTSRLGQVALAPRAIYNCADGKILIMAPEQAMWDRMVEMMGNPDWAREEIFKDRFVRAQSADALNVLIEQWTLEHKTLEVFHEAQACRIPAAPVNTMARAYADEQLKEREFFVPLPSRDPKAPPILVPSAPFKSTAIGWSMSRPAPLLGEHNAEILNRAKPSAKAPAPLPPPASEGPLSGVRVLDFCWVWAGPFCTLQLAHLGAQVIRIETSKRPDINRVIPPFLDKKPGLNRGGSFNQWNQGKLSLQLDLSRSEAIEIVRQLVPHVDIVTENYAPGVIDRMGLGYERLRAIKPDLIMLSLSGYGQTGPFSRYVSYGAMIAAQSGLYVATGYPGDVAREVGVSYADPTAGITGALMVNAALIHRARTGQGQYLDVSLLESLEMFMPEALLQYAINGREPEYVGNRDQWMAPHNCYKSLGDAEQWVTIAVGSQPEWRALCAAMGQHSMADDPRFKTASLRKQNEDELDRIITAWTSTRDRWEVTEMLQRVGVAAIPTFSNKDLALDPHLRERGYLVELEHPEVGRRTHAGIPWTMSATPCRVRRAAALMGQDTDDVLSSILGYSAEKIEQLRQARVLT